MRIFVFFWTVAKKNIAHAVFDSIFLVRANWAREAAHRAKMVGENVEAMVDWLYAQVEKHNK